MIADGNRRGYSLLLEDFWDKARDEGLPLPTEEAISAASCDSRSLVPECLLNLLSVWADLMRRVFEVDVLLCPHCLGKRRIVAFLDDPLVVHRILRHVGLDPEPRPPPLPSQLEMF